MDEFPLTIVEKENSSPMSVETLRESVITGGISPDTPEGEPGRRTRRNWRHEDAELNQQDLLRVSEERKGHGLATGMEEPIAVSRVRQKASSKVFDDKQSKVTVEKARAKLDIVKACEEKKSRRRKLDNFLNGCISPTVAQDILNLSSLNEFNDRPRLLKQAAASLQRARAKLDAVKAKDSGTVKHTTFFAQNPLSREPHLDCNEEKVPGAVSGTGHLLQAGGWSEEVKTKLKAAKMKKAKLAKDGALRGSVGKSRSKKKGTAERSKSPLFGDGSGLVDNEEGIVVTLPGVMVERAKAKLRGMKAKRLKRANPGVLEAQEQELDDTFFESVDRSSDDIDMDMSEGDHDGMNVKIGSNPKAMRVKWKRLRGQAPSRPLSGRNELCVKVLAEKESTQESPNFRKHGSTDATGLATGVGEPSDELLGSTSSLELTSPATRRRKVETTIAELTPPVGARLLSGVNWVPPVSPYGLIQEQLYQDPWKVLVACMLLNKTGGRQMHKVIWDLFNLCPDAKTCISMPTEKIGVVVHSLGLQNKRAKMLHRFSEDYMRSDWTNVTQLHGIGEYARDAYAIFCEGRWQEVQPIDLILNKYWHWLRETQGLGYGFANDV